MNNAAAQSSTANNAEASIADGTFAPMIVSQNTTARISSIIGRPTARRDHAIDLLIEPERMRALVANGAAGDALDLAVERRDDFLAEAGFERSPQRAGFANDVGR